MKYRAWDERYKKMMSPVDIFNSRDLFYEDDSDGTLRLKRILNRDGDREELKLMRGSGVIDRNGVEIFEGDIVSYCRFISNGVEQWETGTGGVIVHHGCFWCGNKWGNSPIFNSVEYKPGDPALMYYANPDGTPTKYLEVKGNIYENKHEVQSVE